MNKKPTLIIIGGFAGAGKTTITTRFASDYSYAVFSSDTINDALRDALSKSFQEVSPIAYKVMWHIVRKQLQLGLTIVVDAHMAAAHIWDSLDELKEDMPDVRVIPIILQATLETHRNRIEERGRTNKEHLNLGGEKIEDVLFKYEFVEKLQRPDLIRINANGGLDEVYSSVEKVIEEKLHSD